MLKKSKKKTQIIEEVSLKWFDQSVFSSLQTKLDEFIERIVKKISFKIIITINNNCKKYFEKHFENPNLTVISGNCVPFSTVEIHPKDKSLDVSSETKLTDKSAQSPSDEQSKGYSFLHYFIIALVLVIIAIVIYFVFLRSSNVLNKEENSYEIDEENSYEVDKENSVKPDEEKFS